MTVGRSNQPHDPTRGRVDPIIPALADAAVTAVSATPMTRWAGSRPSTWCVVAVHHQQSFQRAEIDHIMREIDVLRL
jgi:hypothetical protein